MKKLCQHMAYDIGRGENQVGWTPPGVVESWAHHTLQVASIDMSFAPPLIVVHAYNLGN